MFAVGDLLRERQDVSARWGLTVVLEHYDHRGVEHWRVYSCFFDAVYHWSREQMRDIYCKVA